ncbi:hypothetical protein JTB14_018061 [Gonioctena quinquepunctata]|nr:hypothetical protein JTB14_018061 [Gonioctena quinquepunctata]
MTSKLAQMQARFQQKQMQEREEKLLKLYENQQQRAFDRVGRGSAGSNTSVGSIGRGKVRQMFDERRQKAGIDKSYPLEPLKAKANARTVQSSMSTIKNGKPLVQKREVVQRLYNNINGNESYEEHRFEDDDSDIYQSKSHREMIDMMNNHNLNDSLDNEVMPQIGFDEVDKSYVGEKVKNEVLVKKEPKKSTSNGMRPSVKKSPSPITKKNTGSNRSPPSMKTVSSPRTVVQSTPPKTRSSTLAMGDRGKTSARAPSTARPSAKQSARSTGVVRDDLAECTYCSRRFTSDRIQKHEEVCSKTGKKKRKAYDATKHRVLGTELETYVLKPGGGKAKSTKPKVSKKDWRRTHEEFISAIRSAKEAQAHIARGGKISDLPPPPPSSNPDYVQCPHCGRRFNESAAARHIPKCDSYSFNKPKGPQPKGKITKK